MNDKINKFANYEHPTMSHRYLISITLMLIMIFLPLIFLIGYKARWLFYMLVPGGIILFLCAIPFMINSRCKRRKYYIFSSASKIYTSFVFLNFSYAALTTVLPVSVYLYIVICILMSVSYFYFYYKNKKAIEHGEKVKFKKAKPLSFGMLFLICIISRIVSNLLAETFSNTFVILLAFSMFLFVVFVFIFIAARESLKSQYIKQIEKEKEQQKM